MKSMNEAIGEILILIQQRIRYMEIAHKTMIKHLLEIVPKLEQYKEYRDISISLTGSIYIYLEDDKVIRISNHAAGKSATKKKEGLVENMVFDI